MSAGSIRSRSDVSGLDTASAATLRGDPEGGTNEPRRCCRGSRLIPDPQPQTPGCWSRATVGCCGSAAHWRDLLQRHGKWETLQKRFTRWLKSAVWDEVFAALIKHCNHPYLMLDTTLLRSHRHAGRKKSPQDQALGGARGELISKIQMAPDRLERDPFSIAQTLS